MSIALPFSDTVNNTGILQQTRFLAKLDSTQWPTIRVVNSCNNWKNFLAGYAIAADRRFQWDNTEHSDAPEGTLPSTTASDYSFGTDQQGNQIITLTGISRLDSATGYYIPLDEVDRNDPSVDVSTFGQQTGTPTRYDKIADNIIRLDYKVGSVIAAYFKFSFQRVPPAYTAASTTATTGFSPLLDRGFIVASAYDAALTLGLPNLSALAVERQREEDKAVQYFADRNQDTVRRMTPSYQNNR